MKFESVHICVLCRFNFVRAMTWGHKIAFIDPGRAAQKNMDLNERSVEDYIISVFEKCKDQELILWPFNKE